MKKKTPKTVVPIQSLFEPTKKIKKKRSYHIAPTERVQ